MQAQRFEALEAYGIQTRKRSGRRGRGMKLISVQSRGNRLSQVHKDGNVFRCTKKCLSSRFERYFVVEFTQHKRVDLALKAAERWTQGGN